MNLGLIQYCKMSKCGVCMLARHVLSGHLTPDARQAVMANREEHLLRQQ